jgi:hypothetical protein
MIFDGSIAEMTKTRRQKSGVATSPKRQQKPINATFKCRALNETFRIVLKMNFYSLCDRGVVAFR